MSRWWRVRAFEQTGRTKGAMKMVLISDWTMEELGAKTLTQLFDYNPESDWTREYVRR